MRSGKERERARRPEQPRAPQAVERPTTPAAPRTTARSSASNQRDLERRLDNLERKMDRVLQALETRKKGDKEREGQRWPAIATSEFLATLAILAMLATFLLVSPSPCLLVPLRPR